MTRRKRLKRLKKNWKPHKYQEEAVKFLLSRHSAGLFLDPGLGKTSITLAALTILKEQGMLGKVLLIAPLRVCYMVWAKEIKKWADFNSLKLVILHGPHKDKALEEEADIYCINFEGLSWLLQPKNLKSPKGTPVPIVKRWKELGFEHLIVDELSKFKNTKSKRFKMFKQVVPFFRTRWGLTGTPASNGLLDLFGQCYVLDGGNALGKFPTHYRFKYFHRDRSGFGWEINPGAEEKIYEQISPLVLRMGEELIDMPSLVQRNIRVDLPPELVKTYKKLEKSLIAMLESGQIVASNAAVASGKCRQISNGAVYLTPEIESVLDTKGSREWVDLHNAKLDALEELVNELQGRPLLVAYEFKHDLEKILKRFGKNTPYIGSGVNMVRTKQIEEDWNAGKIPLLLGHPASMGHGMNLQEKGNHICWFSPTWDYELYDQFNRRVRRQGNKASRVYVYRIITRNTVDERVVKALRSKKKGQDALFEALTSLRK